MAVDLWDDKTANLIDDFEDDAGAFRYIRLVIAIYGVDAVSSWGLDRLDGKPWVRGADLVRLVNERVPA